MLYRMILYWPHPSGLVANNGGTNVVPGLVMILFLSLILFAMPAHFMLAIALPRLFGWA